MNSDQKLPKDDIYENNISPLKQQNNDTTAKGDDSKKENATAKNDKDKKEGNKNLLNGLPEDIQNYLKKKYATKKYGTEKDKQNDEALDITDPNVIDAVNKEFNEKEQDAIKQIDEISKYNENKNKEEANRGNEYLKAIHQEQDSHQKQIEKSITAQEKQNIQTSSKNESQVWTSESNIEKANAYYNARKSKIKIGQIENIKDSTVEGKKISAKDRNNQNRNQEISKVKRLQNEMKNQIDQFNKLPNEIKNISQDEVESKAKKIQYNCILQRAALEILRIRNDGKNPKDIDHKSKVIKEELIKSLSEKYPKMDINADALINERIAKISPLVFNEAMLRAGENMSKESSGRESEIKESQAESEHKSIDQVIADELAKNKASDIAAKKAIQDLKNTPPAFVMNDLQITLKSIEYQAPSRQESKTRYGWHKGLNIVNKVGQVLNKSRKSSDAIINNISSTLLKYNKYEQSVKDKILKYCTPGHKKIYTEIDKLNHDNPSKKLTKDDIKKIASQIFSAVKVERCQEENHPLQVVGAIKSDEKNTLKTRRTNQPSGLSR